MSQKNLRHTKRIANLSSKLPRRLSLRCLHEDKTLYDQIQYNYPHPAPIMPPCLQKVNKSTAEVRKIVFPTSAIVTCDKNRTAFRGLESLLLSLAFSGVAARAV
ncbi:hypothetical protein J6590_024490 [Homalodisca vitripennis]|nr:hypothetical protein J6590_024490 [Homalodisca vitripennis]